MYQWQQGTLDSLHLAKQAIERAIANYEAAKGRSDLNTDEGLLFGTLDNLDTAEEELGLAKSIATCQTVS